jgi:hypothetical protein
MVIDAVVDLRELSRGVLRLLDHRKSRGEG